MTDKYKVLILGASYGSLLSTKLLLAGHSVTLICTAGTAALINNQGTVVKLPVRGRDGLLELNSNEISNQIEGVKLTAATPTEVDPADFDLVVLGMQEPQYSSEGARAKVPTMAIMNMPPLPYLKRLKGLDIDSLLDCYAEPSLWDEFEPGLVTLASPDPQAFRPEDAGKNVLQVSLPTNFKVAAFESDQHTGIEEATWPLPEGGETLLPVKLKVFDSLFVPLAKWSMLLTGNYRCVLKNDIRTIRDAVHSNVAESEEVYSWVVSLCEELGADRADLVPFEKYANAASGLVKPSSAARALFNGAGNIERVDRLVRNIARQYGMQNDSVENTVAFVDAHLAVNNNERKAS